MSSRWNDLEGISPWRSAAAPKRGDLFVLPSPDRGVAEMLLLSGSIPLSVHLGEPPEGQATPYVMVQPLDATTLAPARRVRVTLVRPDGRDERTVDWNADDYDTRVAFGDVVRDYAAKLTG